MRRLLWPAIAVAAILSAGATTLVVLDARGDTAEEEPEADFPTAVVELGDITAVETWKGTLDHGTPATIGTAASGTVTRLPAVGDDLAVGDTEIYVDEQPVVLLEGVIPMYRDLGPGDKGRDVEQLERGLADLGYDGFTVDREFTWYTAEAVRRWQRDLKVEKTGTVGADAVVFVAEGGRVDRLHVAVGDTVAAGDAVLDLSGPEVFASLEVEVSDLDLVETGTEVLVLPADGTTVAGTVARREVVEADAEAEGEEAEPVARIEVALAEPVPEEQIGSPVSVEVVVERREDVLLVPVSALLALSEGGFGLQLAGQDAIVVVETGLFADGKVEITGEGLTEGTEVGTAGR
ncbi:peptidoglycan-binding domain-containing protein [Glycomyces harbinensis]|uniref:Putative peptidoglycan binding domain-containing protein n=1 Tax=Glycomyces harbinensis TaxID=58114 RepID=A0A1G7B4D3_9ACTN|nr:peptidoglycan-binding domain-containing protein [Glycomyces harbinensis]SDE21095.1 Putative peptidoglycan binding domain-containing protein [Glycomyces harbinensis]